MRQHGRWSELLYRGLDFEPTTGWSGRAPILWPAVGRNFLSLAGSRSGKSRLGWTLHGRPYPIAIHGFARDQSWQVVNRGACRGSAFVTLALRDNARTRASYPFGFELSTEYRIWRDALYIRQSVRAARENAEAMPFSIGNHITFRIPLLPGGDAGLTTISSPATEQVMTDESGRPTGRVSAVNYGRPRRLSSLKPLTPISLSGYPRGLAWVRIEDPSGLSVTISHSEDRRPGGTPVLFNLWGDIRQGFFAPEPWVGKQDSLATGDGVIRLAPGDTFRWTIEVRVTAGAGMRAASPRSQPPRCMH